jgi:hypothetical protein
MSVVRNFVNDPYWLIDFFIFFGCFNATFSNISAILWLPVLVVDEAGVSGENHRHGQATGKLYHLRPRVECTFFVRHQCGSLEADLFRAHIIIDPSFPCRCPLEDAIHYLLQCPLYRNARIQLCINIIP